MSEPEYLIVLYSKYSHACNEVLELYSQAPVDFIKFICVDNVTTRQQLLSSKRLNISVVPCVLLMYPGGEMEKFEEGDVSGWLKSQISKYLPQEQITHLQVPNTHQHEQVEEQVTQIQQLEQPPQEQTPMVDLMPTMTQEVPPKKEKSISDIAAEMAAERDGADIPIHQRKQQLQQQGMTQALS